MQNLQSLTHMRTLGGGAKPRRYAYLNLTGNVADYANTADKAVLDLTTELDVIVCISMNDWTPSVVSTVLSKYDFTNNTRAYRLEIQPTGTVTLGLSANGIALTTINSSVATGFADRSVRWVRATWRASDGRVQFFTSSKSPGSVPSGADWVQLGTDRTIAIAGIFDSSAQLMIGRQQPPDMPPNPMAGRVYRILLKSGIDGTIVADFNPTGHLSMTSWADAYGNTWAINGAATIRE